MLLRFYLSMLAYIVRFAFLCLSSQIPESRSGGWSQLLGGLLFPFLSIKLRAPCILSLEVGPVVSTQLPFGSVGRPYCSTYFGVSKGWYR